MIIVKFSTGKNIGSIFLHTKCTTKMCIFPPKCSAQRLVKRIKGNSAILGNIKISPFLLCTNLAISCIVFPPPVQSKCHRHHSKTLFSESFSSSHGDNDAMNVQKFFHFSDLLKTCSWYEKKKNKKHSDLGFF